MSLDLNKPTRIVSHADGNDISGLLAQHKVLRQTYMLLGANLLFSAFCAYLGVLFGGVRIPTFVAMALVIGLSMGISYKRNSGVGIALLFALTGFLGFYLSGMLSLLIGASMGSLITKALVGTAVIFFALSFYVLKTGTNFSFLGGFLFIATIVLFLAVLGMMLFGITAGQVVISSLFLLLFSGYVLYDTSNILHGEETNYIVATLNLFMNIYNIFVSLLSILAASRD